MIKIVADSSADLMTLDGIDFAVASLRVITAERHFVDDSALDVGEMVTYFDKYKGKSQTSCPNANDWIEAFGGADEVICVTITSSLSGSYNAACVAKQTYEAEGEGRRVFVLDSLSAGPELALAVYKLRELISAGLSFDEVVAEIKKYTEKTGLLFMLKSLKNLANNGRVSHLTAKIAGFIGIHLVGRASTEGTLEQLDKCRGEIRAIDGLLARLESEGYAGGFIRICNVQNPSAAEKLSAKVLEKYPTAKVEIAESRGLCSFYAENGGLMIGFEKK